MGIRKSTLDNIAGKKRWCMKRNADKGFKAYLTDLASGKIFAKPGQEIAKPDIKNVISRLEKAWRVTVPYGEFEQAEDLYGFYQEWCKK
jgi:hypothetical protein